MGIRERLYDKAKAKKEAGTYPLTDKDLNRLDPNRPKAHAWGKDTQMEYDRIKREQDLRERELAILEAMGTELGYEGEPEPEEPAGFSAAASATDPMEAAGGLPAGGGRQTLAPLRAGGRSQYSGNPDFAPAPSRAQGPAAAKPRPTLMDSALKNRLYSTQEKPAEAFMGFARSKEMSPGMQQWADKNLGGGEKPDVAGQDYINMLSRLGLGGEANETAKKMVESRYSGANAGTGGGATGARLRFAKEHPELVTAAKDVIQKLRDSGEYSDEYLTSLDALADSDPMLTLQTISTKRAGTDEGLIREEKGIPLATREASATTTAREVAGRNVQAAQPILGKAEREALLDSYNGVDYLNTLKSAIVNGNIDWFDPGKAGEFKNAKVNNANTQLVEVIGRNRSGAAISETEWKNFAKEIMNRNFLLTDEGKKTAVDQLDTFIDRFFASGSTAYGNENWYNQVKEMAKKSRALGEASGSTETAPGARAKRDEARRAPAKTFDEVMGKYGQ